MGTPFEILDCTLRDGGYTNDWHFDKGSASRLLELSIKNGCSYFELGFLFPAQDKIRALGPFAFSRPRLLDAVAGKQLHSDINIGFMVNSSDYSNFSEIEIRESLGRKDGQNTFDFVRVATRPGGVEEALALSRALVDLGYQVMLNLMQAHSISEVELVKIVKSVNSVSQKKSKGKITHIYLADTMGSMTPVDVKKKIQTLAENTELEIGFHAHDNLRLALANSLAAVDSGASLIDGTLTGIGRGIGNTWVELLYLIRNNPSRLKSLAELIALGADYFATDKSTYLAEASYAISGKFGVHPNYVSAILENGLKYFHQIPEVFSELKEDEKSSFSEFGADLSTIWYSQNKKVTEITTDEIAGESFLLIAPGESSTTFREDLLTFSQLRNVQIGLLSPDQDLPSESVDYLFYCNPLSVLTGKMANTMDAKVVAPFSCIPPEYIKPIEPKYRVDFGLRIDADQLTLEENHLIAPNSRVYLYAIAFLISRGVRKIYLAGFDGYEHSDPRNNEFMENIRRLKEIYPDLSIKSLTPTKYDLEIAQLFL